MSLTHDILMYIDAERSHALELLLTLARIPAPSNHEERRAKFCLKWLHDHGAASAYIDGAMNVVYPVGDVTGPVTVVMAHSDVVFPDTDELPLTVEDGKIKCPGVGDDTANVAALLTVAGYIAEKDLAPSEGGLLLVVNSGEEGLGNLRGSREIMRAFGGRVRRFFTLDGCIESAVNAAVGSKRYEITVRTEGGHSYNSFGNRNAIAVMASLIDLLYSFKVPEGGRTTYNVGTISGGTSVNTIAQEATMLYEFRSDARASLEDMERRLDAALNLYRAAGIDISCRLIGDRPCSGDVDPAAMRELEGLAAGIVREHCGTELRFSPGSTDCNIPLSMGVPALCVGCYRGSGAHTRQEYVELDSLLPGLKIAFDLILGFCR